MRTIRRGLSKLFPQASERYKRFRTAAYLRYFEMFPTLASSMREFRQGAHKTHHASFGMQLVGPGYLIDSGLEAEEIELVKLKLRDADVFVDVGANVGLYTCLAASAGRKVIAFEPLASNLRYLYQNLIRNKLQKVEVFPVGLSSEPGLSVLAGVGAQASFLTDWAKDGYAHNRYVTNVCPTSTLDLVLGNRFAGQRLLVKVDVEGFEYQVIQGGTQTLARVPKPTWIVECFLEKYHPGGQNPNFAQTFETFFDHGYTARVASTKGAVISKETVDRWVQQGAVEGDAQNFIFEPE